MSDRRHQSSRDERRRDRDGDRNGDRRRRSRSPGHRQRTGQEENSYETSRSYREREREQRYGGSGGAGGGGGDRERRDWDRSGGRRDARRDDDRRDSRRDRDLFDDRRRPREDGRGDGRDREDKRRDQDDMRQMERQTRQKSASPVRKPKEPTPDLTDVVSVLQKTRRLTQWDIRPPGYENVTAEQAKLSGMFPLPGAPRAQPIDRSRLEAFMAQPQNQVSQNALSAATSRQSKRVFVHNLPSSVTDAQLADFFNLQLNGLNITQGRDPCISANVTADHQKALLEFKTSEDATNAMALSGVTMTSDDMDASNGTSNGAAKGLQIRRPKDYIVPIITDETQNENGVLSRVVPDTQNKICVSNIPTFLTEDQVQELLQSFGELRSFVLAKDVATDASRGFAFCEWVDPNVTTTATEALNGMQLGDANLTVQKASIGIQQAGGGEMSVNAMSMMAGATATDGAEVGRVLCLMNMITQEELLDPDEADEILEDVKEECEKFGPVLEVKMPRPSRGSRNTDGDGHGKIYIKYEDPASAQKALSTLAGRKFADRTVVATFFGEEYFDLGAW